MKLMVLVCDPIVGFFPFNRCALECAVGCLYNLFWCTHPWMHGIVAELFELDSLCQHLGVSSVFNSLFLLSSDMTVSSSMAGVACVSVIMVFVAWFWWCCACLIWLLSFSSKMDGLFTHKIVTLVSPLMYFFVFFSCWDKLSILEMGLTKDSPVTVQLLHSEL